MVAPNHPPPLRFSSGLTAQQVKAPGDEVELRRSRLLVNERPQRII